MPIGKLSSSLSWVHLPPAPLLLEARSTRRAWAASHDPLPGLEGEAWEETCEEWQGKNPRDRKFKEGPGGGGEQGLVPRALQWRGLRREGEKGMREECKGVGKGAVGAGGFPSEGREERR